MDSSNNSINNENRIIDISQNEILKQKYLQQRHEYYERVKIESINMICRQTDYSKEEAKEKLEKYNYNYQLVLNEYFGIEEKPTKDKTTNQMIYGEIRNLMDTGAKQFRIEQEKSKKYQEYIEKKKNTN